MLKYSLIALVIALGILVANLEVQAHPQMDGEVPVTLELHGHAVRLDYFRYEGTCNWLVRVYINDSFEVSAVPAEISCEAIEVTIDNFMAEEPNLKLDKLTADE